VRWQEEGSKAVSEEPDRRRQEELAFFGRIGADISHDMRNVLAVIGQYAGLQGDLLALAKRRKPPDCEKLKELCAKIVAQVRRGTEAMDRFSRFAHAADEETASFDLTALADTVTALAQRQAKLARCRLEAELPGEAVPMRASPFRVQHAVFSAVWLMLGALDKGEVLTIRLLRQGPAAAMSFSGSDGGDGENPEGLSRLSALMDALGGSVETARADGVVSLTLTFPIE
jgi:signal transduction histidine kinase